jgi:phosphoribosyl 1,2-cyclic phosphodiesterase
MAGDGMKVDILGSGSSGNAVVVDGGEGPVLIDCGFGPRTIATRMRAADVRAEDVVVAVLTHEHSDHVSGIVQAGRKWGWRVAATAGTIRGTPGLKALSPEVVTAPQRLRAAGLVLEFLATPHDAAESIAVIVTHAASGCRMAVVTDLGHWTPAIAKRLQYLDALVLEANHDVEMLRTGPYPVFLQKRIAGPEGHLSNEDASSLCAEATHPALRTVVLAHLSEKNNTPQVALGTVKAGLKRANFRGTLLAASQSSVLSFEIGVTHRTRQLALSL